jgi:hypothetical protein
MFKKINRRKKLLKSVFDYDPKYDGMLTNNNECNKASYYNTKNNKKYYNRHDLRQIQDMKEQVLEYYG